MCIDGSFLNAFLGGYFMTAIGITKNNQIFPRAWAVIESENNYS